MRRGSQNAAMTTKIDQKIESLQKQIAQAKALRMRQQAATRAKALRVERALETRQKVLVGAFVLSKSGSSAADYAKNNPEFAAWLSRAIDREAFGLSPVLKAQKTESTAA